jgi:ATP/maltotriose-dependent transcriptional regulator MalT
MARVMMEQGLLARRQGRFREAAELYDEAADGFREADDLVGAARARLGLARVRCQQLDLAAARSWVDVAGKAATDLLDRRLAAEAMLVDGDVRRLGSDADGAEASYRGYLSLGDASGPEGRVFAELGLAQLALARDDAHEAYERANGAAAALESLPHHWLWAPYRLVVAALLADRGDHMQTWQWLWSASELGLGDTVDRDTVALLTRVCNVAKLAGWGNVIRVSANLAVEQLERLGDRDGAERVKRDITGIILK